MKKFIFLMICFFALVCGVKAIEGKTITFDDVSTKNLEQKLFGVNYREVKSLCSFDFCDYAIGSSYKEILDNFTKNYLKTIENEEVRANLKIKGIKITKIIFQN